MLGLCRERDERRDPCGEIITRDLVLDKVCHQLANPLGIGKRDRATVQFEKQHGAKERRPLVPVFERMRHRHRMKQVRRKPYQVGLIRVDVGVARRRRRTVKEPGFPQE